MNAKYVPAGNGAEIHVHDYSCTIPCEVPARRIADAVAANDGDPDGPDDIAALRAIAAIDAGQVRCGDLALVDAQGGPVHYATDYAGNGHATFTIIRAVNPIPGTLPTLEVQHRGSAGTVERFAHRLFDGWHWVSVTA